jgi:glucosyl-3-phosphoglycerate synthase
VIRRFHHTDFLPLQHILKAKRRRNLSVSLVIPARNEAATIATIVGVCRQELICRIPLLDEVVVMDGGSSDSTADRARAAGARVYPCDEVAIEFPAPIGKGAALWKSLFVTTGRIIVCIDADITNFDARFVYGLVAPLILQTDIELVKAAYQRHLVLDGVCHDNHGGRVTELLVRPAFSAFYPELATISQPLAGEYAFNRSIIEQCSFFSGYGVEVGILLDILCRCGVHSIAEVDMDTRLHRNRPLAELGRMSFGILQALLCRMQEEKKAVFAAPPAASLPVADGNGWKMMDTVDTVLPPVADCKGGG